MAGFEKRKNNRCFKFTHIQEEPIDKGSICYIVTNIFNGYTKKKKHKQKK